MFSYYVRVLNYFERKVFNSGLLLAIKKGKENHPLNKYCVDCTSAKVVFQENRLPKSVFSGGIFEKLKKHQSIFDRFDKNELELSIEILMKCQFGEQNLIELLDRHPNILFVSPEIIETHYCYLYTKFKKPTIFKIFLNTPEVLNESLESLKRKIDYLKDKMGVSDIEISKSGALAYSLTYIKERHTFLEKSGNFKVFNPKQKQITEPNPSLGHIVNLPVTDFTRKVAGLSLIEFETFQLLFEDEEAENDF